MGRRPPRPRRADGRQNSTAVEISRNRRRVSAADEAVGAWQKERRLRRGAGRGYVRCARPCEGRPCAADEICERRADGGAVIGVVRTVQPILVMDKIHVERRAAAIPAAVWDWRDRHLRTDGHSKHENYQREDEEFHACVIGRSLPPQYPGIHVTNTLVPPRVKLNKVMFPLVVAPKLLGSLKVRVGESVLLNEQVPTAVPSTIRV